ncbi:hypothetical protein [Telluribacter humicola]|uniref:hypothetical protein n=1 Tax=Telluribacter humicola TaxID=1720261 RepID=UPI001A95DE84|nr:hypothetical protein [Telluribacter humicola]
MNRSYKIAKRLLLLMIAGMAFSCQTDKQPTPNMGYDYFPLEVGQYVEYQVQETRYSLAQSPASRTFQRRETITDTYTDATGQTIYLIERSVLQMNGEWKTDSLMTSWRTTERAMRTENGRTEVKLFFPVTERQRWNGNLYNQQEERIFEATQVAKPITLGTQPFEHTVTVVQQNDSTLVALRRLREVYAKNVGLVQRERVFLQYCSTPDCAGQGKIDYGIKEISTISGYGTRQ